MRRSLLYAAILGFAGFVTSFGAHIVAVNLPTYAAAVGIGLAMIGLLIAIYDFAEILAKPVYGALADKQGDEAYHAGGHRRVHGRLTAVSGD